MLSEAREIVVGRSQAEVWDFVGDMGNWARQLPGYISHEELEDNNSVWTVLVNLGPFKRPVVIDVNVTQWLPPHTVAFELKGRVEPFHGAGIFRTFASDANTQSTRMLLQFNAEPTGPMAVMLTGLAQPVLSRVADEFTRNLKNTLDPAAAAMAPGKHGPMNVLHRWLNRFVRRAVEKIRF